MPIRLRPTHTSAGVYAFYPLYSHSDLCEYPGHRPTVGLTRERQMTQQYPAPMAHLSRPEYETICAQQQTAAAALAAKWGVDAVGREYPDQVTRSDGYRFARAGKWYVVRGGKRAPATAAQARALNATGVAHGVGSVGPIAASA